MVLKNPSDYEDSESDEYLIKNLANNYNGSEDDIISLGKELERMTRKGFMYEELESALDVYREKDLNYSFAALHGMVLGGKVGENEFLDPDDTISAEMVEQTLEEDYEITNPNVGGLNIGSTVGNNEEGV